MYNFIQKRRIWLSISGALVGLSIIALFVYGLNFGIDFTGGSLLEVRFINERPAVNDVQVAVADLDLGGVIVQPIDEKNMILRFKDTSEEKHVLVLERLNKIGEKQEDDSENIATNNVEELRYDSVGPSIGEELKSKSFWAIVIVLIAIVLYIAWAFNKVSKPVASWKYGVAATIALFHDVIITMGAFAIMGHFYGIEVNTPFVAAILTLLGYSVNDTIVVFDRIRENLPKSHEDFENTVNNSVNQTLQRSINTSMTVILALVAILIFGGDTIKDFVLALTIGVFIGTYSSIFIASPVLVIWEKMKKA